MQGIRIFWIFFTLLAFTSAIGQVNFEETRNFQFNESVVTQTTVSMADVNGDGWDDLVGLDDGQLFISLSSSNRVSTDTRIYLNNLGTGINILVGDINRNGINEIVISYFGSQDKIDIYELNPETLDLELLESIAIDIYPQGANLVDINNDGWLDLFLCNDVGPNLIFYNDTNGFFMTGQSLSIETEDLALTSGNYSSEWSDIDMDGDKDLYISKCSAQVSSPDDPRRINNLFVNENGNLSERASSMGLSSGSQSWVTEIEDFDNDGDMDLYIVNHNDRNQCFENLGDNNFREITNALPIFEDVPNNAQAADFDNNGYIDILVGGGLSRHVMLWNYGSFNFEMEELSFRTGSSAIGDIDRDGFIDIYSSFKISNEASIPNTLLKNDGNGNSFASFCLIGLESNTNGIGSILQVHTSSLVQTKELKAGEGYGIMNSLNVHFGLGNTDIIDSLIILWPSGIKQVHSNIEANNFYTISEGKCITKNKCFVPDTNIICNDESIDINLPDNYSGFASWSTGVSNSTLQVDASLTVHLQVNNDGCLTQYAPISILKNPIESKLEIIPEKTIACLGEEIELITNFSEAVEWSNNQISASTTITTSQSVIAKSQGSCINNSDTIDFEFIEVDIPHFVNDTVPLGESAILTSGSMNTYWYGSQDDLNPIAEGAFYEIERLEQDETVYAATFASQSPASQFGGLSSDPMFEEFHHSSLNGSLEFTALVDFFLESVEVNSEAAGIRTIRINRMDGTRLFEKEYDIDVGTQTIQIGQLICQGEGYIMTTSTNQNQRSFGYNSPSFSIRQIDDQTGTYPYITANLLSIPTSSFGTFYYPYFYNWQIREAELICESDRSPVYAIVEDPSSVLGEDTLGNLSYYPNPIQNILTVEIPNPSAPVLLTEIFTTSGSKVRSELTEIIDNQLIIYMHSIDVGTYMIKISDPESNIFSMIKVIR